MGQEAPAPPAAPAAEVPAETRTPGIGNWSTVHVESASSGLTPEPTEAPTATEAAPAAPANDNAPAAAEPTVTKPASVELAELTKRAAIAQRIEKRNEERERAISARERAAEERDKSFAEADELAVLQQVAKAKGIELNALLRRGIQRLANNGEVAPEEAAKVERERRDREAAEIKARLDARDKADRERADQERANADVQLQRQWADGTTSLARELKADLPFVGDLPDHEIGARALDLVAAYVRNLTARGEQIDEAYLVSPACRREALEIIEKQEREAEERSADTRMERLRRLGKIPAANDNVTASSVPASVKAETQGTGPANPARTLTNNGAAQRPNGARPLSDRDRYRWAAEAIPDTPNG